MKPTEKNGLSYFRLKLEAYLGGYHPELMTEETFIVARAGEALEVYSDAIAQGFSNLEAESIASETLFVGLHFSKYALLESVLEGEFADELPEPLPQSLTPLLLKHRAIQTVFERYHLTDDFDSTPERDLLYTELTGAIALLIEVNGLPTLASMSTQRQD